MVDVIITLTLAGIAILCGCAIVFETPLTYIAGVNLICSFVYGYDKIAAVKHSERVPERFLLFLGLLGGTPGSLIAMLLFRHKICKKKFYIPVILILFAQLALYMIFS